MKPSQQTKRSVALIPALLLGLLLGSLNHIASGQSSLTNGLVVFFPFNGNANDAAGTNHGIVHGATLATDRFGNANQAYSFDGHSDISLSYRAPLQPQSSFTYALWIYVSTNTGGAVIIDRTPQDTLDSIVMLAWQEAPQPGYSFDVRYDDFTYPASPT